MRRTYILMVVLSLFLAGALAAPVTFAQSTSGKTPATPPAPSATVKMEVTLGGQTRIITDDPSGKWSKFEQTRDVPKNFTLNGFNFAIEKEGSPWTFTGSAEEATQLDQRYRFVVEKYGVMRTTLRFDSYPQFISRTVKSPFTASVPGIYSVADSFQSALQAAASAGVPAIASDLLLNTPFADLRARRQRFSMDNQFTINNNWSTFVLFNAEHRGGLKPIGLGTYERISTPVGNNFNVLGDELPEPINYRTYEVRAGIAFHNQRAFLRVEYAYQWFTNRAGVLRWENPFSLTDQEGTSGGNLNRWRFGTGQLDLYPDNRVQTITLNGRVKLPADSFLSGLLSWSFRRQNDAFLPWTLNTAVVTGVPVGVTPTNAATLPRANLDGRVNVFNSDVVLGTRNWKQLLLTSRYRMYRYHSDTAPIALPGYVAFGDAYWRSNLSCVNPDRTTNLCTNVLFTAANEPASYTRQQVSFEVVWKPWNEFQWKIEPNWEGWNREHRQADRTNEYGVTNQVIFKPVNWFNARASYRYANRKPERYDSGPLEFGFISSASILPAGGHLAGLRRFDQNHRIRNNADLVLNFMGDSKWSLSATYGYHSDQYDENFFGLGKFLTGSAGVDLNFTPSDQYGFVAYYNHDRNRYNYRQIAKGGGANTWVLQNEWDRDTRDKVDSFGVGFNASAVEQRFQFNLSYDFSLARQTITTRNPNTVQANMVNDATAFPWPDIKSRFHEFRADGSYRFRSNVVAGVRYLFEPYRLDDFATDVMRPYMFGFEAPENDTRRALFLDSRYGSYNGHLFGVYVKYTF
ncbi:MAG: MtrB/PioB family outer membrane beta-barrel protein [Acidobacteria bacterium]|nr:MtrB/PioB family outer membrane beta-barrel protein [Acidobacteriota bacterium]MBI3661561.1 MtrB/PioB family outer membrane beta-barrel protein [Acidobacteriota bacterium]